MTENVKDNLKPNLYPAKCHTPFITNLIAQEHFPQLASIDLIIPF